MFTNVFQPAHIDSKIIYTSLKKSHRISIWLVLKSTTLSLAMQFSNNRKVLFLKYNPFIG